MASFQLSLDLSRGYFRVLCRKLIVTGANPDRMRCKKRALLAERVQWSLSQLVIDTHTFTAGFSSERTLTKGKSATIITINCIPMFRNVERQALTMNE
jgi:hypothetical protein